MTEDEEIGIRAHLETDDELRPLDNGQPGFYLTGLRDIQGTFSAPLSEGVAALFAPEGEIHTLYFYGPDPKTPWWKHWFYRIRERLTDEPYPTVVLASGPARMSFHESHEDGEDVVFTGSFTSTGHWKFHDEEVNP